MVKEYWHTILKWDYQKKHTYFNVFKGSISGDVFAASGSSFFSKAGKSGKKFRQTFVINLDT